MAESSPMFKPPVPASAPDNDPMVSRIDMKSTQWGARPSQQKGFKGAEEFSVENIKNGR